MHQQSYGIIPFDISSSPPRILLIQHVAGHWSFPKGKVEPNETPEQTATRELQEETGLMLTHLINDISFTETYSFDVPGEHIEKTVIYFIGFIKDHTVTIQHKEILDYRWVTYEEGLPLITFPEAKKVLTDAMTFLKTYNS